MGPCRCQFRGRQQQRRGATGLQQQQALLQILPGEAGAAVMEHSRLGESRQGFVGGMNHQVCPGGQGVPGQAVMGAKMAAVGLVHQHRQALAVAKLHQRRQRGAQPLIGGIHQQRQVHGAVQGCQRRQHPLKPGHVYGLGQPPVPGKGEGVVDGLKTGQHHSMEYGAVQVAGAEQTLAWAQDPQQGGLQQPCGAVDAKPAGPATPKLCRGLLGLGHRTVGQQRSPQTGQLRQIQWPQWPREQCRQPRWKTPAPPMGGQMEGERERCRLLQSPQEDRPRGGFQRIPVHLTAGGW